VESALSAEFALQERDAMLQRAVAENARGLDLANVRYRVGIVDLRAVQQQSLALYASRTALLRVQTERLVQRVNLHLALGGGFDTASQLSDRAYQIPLALALGQERSLEHARANRPLETHALGKTNRRVDGKKLTKVSEVEVRGWPEGAVFRADGRWLCVGNFVDRDISVLRIDGDTLINTGRSCSCPVGRHPCEGGCSRWISGSRVGRRSMCARHRGFRLKRFEPRAMPESLTGGRDELAVVRQRSLHFAASGLRKKCTIWNR
jgi:hypothetical protein